MTTKKNTTEQICVGVQGRRCWTIPAARANDANFDTNAYDKDQTALASSESTQRIRDDNFDCESDGATNWRLDPSNDETFFYTGFHLSELQMCTLIFSTNFILFSNLNSTGHNLVIELCRAIYFLSLFLRLFINWRNVLQLLIY